MSRPRTAHYCRPRHDSNSRGRAKYSPSCPPAHARQRPRPAAPLENPERGPAVSRCGQRAARVVRHVLLLLRPHHGDVARATLRLDLFDSMKMRAPDCARISLIRPPRPRIPKVPTSTVIFNCSSSCRRPQPQRHPLPSAVRAQGGTDALTPVMGHRLPRSAALEAASGGGGESRNARAPRSALLDHDRRRRG